MKKHRKLESVGSLLIYPILISFIVGIVLVSQNASNIALSICFGIAFACMFAAELIQPDHIFTVEEVDQDDELKRKQFKFLSCNTFDDGFLLSLSLHRGKHIIKIFLEKPLEKSGLTLNISK